MLYEIVWFFFALGIAIFLSIGLFGLFFSPSIPGKALKKGGVILSVLILLAGAYLSYQWYSGKKEIQGLTRQVEKALHQYWIDYKLNKEGDK